MSSSIHSHLFQRIASALAAWRRRQQDRRQMLAMSDAELRDLGIGRGQIPALLETVPFVEGWGVEIGLLIDLVANFGIDAIAQVDLDVREHRNRPLDELGPQAMAILVTGLRRAGVPVDKRLAELVRYDDDQQPERVAVEIRERPPMLTVPAYRARFARELSA